MSYPNPTRPQIRPWLSRYGTLVVNTVCSRPSAKTQVPSAYERSPAKTFNSAAGIGGLSGGEKVRVGKAQHLGGILPAPLLGQGFVDHQKTAVQSLM